QVAAAVRTRGIGRRVVGRPGGVVLVGCCLLGASRRERPVRVGDKVLGRVGGGQSLGDDEVGGGEAEQDQDQQLAPPAEEEALQHADGALALGRTAGDVSLDG